MTMEINTLFKIDVTDDPENENNRIFDLYLGGEHAWRTSGGSAWANDESTVLLFGKNMMREYCKHMELTLMHAVAIVYVGWFEVKWWYEVEARDTTAMFNQQISRPELVEIQSFEYLIPSGSFSDNSINLAHALMQYAAHRGIHPSEAERPIIRGFGGKV